MTVCGTPTTEADDSQVELASYLVVLILPKLFMH